MNYIKTNIRFSNFGLNLTNDPITLPFGKYTKLDNVTTKLEGTFQPRSGITKGHTSAIGGPDDIQQIRRLNNTASGATDNFLIKAATNLYRTNSVTPNWTNTLTQGSMSGNMGSIIPYRPSLSNTMWAYIFDSSLMFKTDGTSTVHPFGYTRPSAAHTTGTHDFATAQEASASGSLTANSTYYYRFALYSSTTGAESIYNSPEIASTTIDGTHLNIDITTPDLLMANYTGVNKIRIYRKGGVVSTWRLVTTAAYTGTSTTINDAASDATVAAADAEDENSNQPFTVTNTSGVDAAGTALPYASDPYLGYILACGDPVNPGYLYWTNKFDPDRQDPDNRIEVTSPQDPLQNIIIYNGRPMVFSKNGLYELFVGLSDTTTFTPSKTSCNRGLVVPAAVTIGPEIYFVSYDGVYATGGGVERNLITEDLRPLFLGGTTSTNGLFPINFTSNTAYIKLAFYKRELWFNYCDTQSAVNQLIYNVDYGRWRHSSSLQIKALYSDEDSQNLWLGTDQGNGFVYYNNGIGTATDAVSDAGTAIPCSVQTQQITFGAPLIQKEWGQLVLDANPAGVTLTLQCTINNNYGSVTTKSTTSSSATRTKIYLDLGPTYGEDATITISWSSSSATPILYGYEILYRPDEPTLTSWNLQAEDHGIEGWQILRSAYICLQANGTVVFSVSNIPDSGTLATSTYTLTPGSANPTKLFVPLNPTKGKLFTYALTLGTATSFKFYPDESEVHVKPWLTSFGYQTVNPFKGGSGSGSSDGVGSISSGGGVGQSQGGSGVARGPQPSFSNIFDFSGGSGGDIVPPSAASTQSPDGWVNGINPNGNNAGTVDQLGFMADQFNPNPGGQGPPPQ